jgi:hypothetical protein
MNTRRDLIAMTSELIASHVMLAIAQFDRKRVSIKKQSGNGVYYT